MKTQDGGNQLPNSLKTAKAYCQGRAEKVASALITTNPHVAGTPEYLAWNRGWRLYEAAGTTTQKDSCAIPAKFTAPTISGALNTGDLSGLSYDFTTSSELPVSYHFGDGSASEMAEIGALTHAFPRGGSYNVKAEILGKIVATTSVTVTYARLDVQASFALNEATGAITATYTENGLPVSGKSIAAESSDEEVFTVETPVVTDAAGHAEFTLTQVADGTATLTLTKSSGPVSLCTVTVTVPA